jgi:hypothetical protein
MRIRGELLRLGINVSATTLVTVLRAATTGRVPGPRVRSSDGDRRLSRGRPSGRPTTQLCTSGLHLVRACARARGRRQPLAAPARAGAPSGRVARGVAVAPPYRARVRAQEFGPMSRAPVVADAPFHGGLLRVARKTLLDLMYADRARLRLRSAPKHSTSVLQGRIESPSTRRRSSPDWTSRSNRSARCRSVSSRTRPSVDSTG